jgi:hypothetical protein
MICLEHAIEKQFGKLKDSSEAHLASIGEVIDLSGMNIGLNDQFVRIPNPPEPEVEYNSFPPNYLTSRGYVTFERYEFWITDGQNTQIAKNLYKRVM